TRGKRTPKKQRQQQTAQDCSGHSRMKNTHSTCCKMCLDGSTNEVNLAILSIRTTANHHHHQPQTGVLRFSSVSPPLARSREGQLARKNESASKSGQSGCRH